MSAAVATSASPSGGTPRDPFNETAASGAAVWLLICIAYAAAVGVGWYAAAMTAALIAFGVAFGVGSALYAWLFIRGCRREAEACNCELRRWRSERPTLADLSRADDSGTSLLRKAAKMLLAANERTGERNVDAAVDALTVDLFATVERAGRQAEAAADFGMAGTGVGLTITFYQLGAAAADPDPAVFSGAIMGAVAGLSTAVITTLIGSCTALTLNGLVGEAGSAVEQLDGRLRAVLALFDARIDREDES